MTYDPNTDSPTYPTWAHAEAAAAATLRAQGLDPADFDMFQLVLGAFWNRTPVLVNAHSVRGYGARDMYAFQRAAAGARIRPNISQPIPYPTVWPPAVPSDETAETHG